MYSAAPPRRRHHRRHRHRYRRAQRESAETCGAANWLQSWVINPARGKVMVGLLSSDLPRYHRCAAACSEVQLLAACRSGDVSSAMLASAGNSGCRRFEYGCCVSELGSGSYKPGDVVNLTGAAIRSRRAESAGVLKRSPAAE